MLTKKIKNLILILTFIEGGAVMCVELCSAKILSPFFGTSIYIWASVLGITLTALMCGYYLGGYISSKNRKKEIIFWIMLIAGSLVTLTPIISDFVLPITINLNLLTGSIISLLSFLFLPLVLFGATSPLIINLLTENAKESGKSTGNIYAISTLGGIITTFLIGFYTLPEFGITKTLYGYGILVMSISAYLFLASKTFKTPVSIIFLICILSYNFHGRFSNKEVIYQSEGVLGEIKVVDRSLFNASENLFTPHRELLVNNITQSIINLNDIEKSYWDYVDILIYNIESYTKGKETLLLGLGGGSLYNKLASNNYNIDAVEFDERIKDVALKYFYLNKEANIIIDDARHYIKVNKKKYDVIIYDLYHSESQPIHLLTKEAFAEIKDILTDDGILIINYYGFITGNKGKGARSIYKTLINNDYNVRLMTTPGKEKERNQLFICSTNELKSQKEIIHTMIYEMDIDLDDVFILTDDKPILEHIYLEAALSWRKGYNEVNAKPFLKN